MRATIGVLLAGGLITIIGAMMGKRQRRSVWRAVSRNGQQMLSGMNWNRMARRGRRLIRQMG